MSKRDDLFAKVFRLVSASREGGLTDADRKELEALVSGSDAARDLYLELIYETLDLESWLGQQGAEGAVVSPKVPAAEGKLRWNEVLFRPTPFSLTSAALFMAVLITGMAFMAGPAYRALTRSTGAEEPRIVATLAAVHNAVWATGQIDARRGAFLRSGQQLDLTSGKARIAFHSGAELVVEAPLRIELLSENSARLESGRLTAQVPKRAQGFSIKTSTAEIVDLGTEFALEVDGRGQERLYVFVGKVRLARKNSTVPQTTEEIHAGEGIAWIAEGPATSFTQAPSQRFATIAAELHRHTTVLFSDNFNATDTDNFDSASLEGRRSGVLAGDIVLRSSRAQHGIAGNQLRLLCPPSGSGRVRFQKQGTDDWHDWAAGPTAETLLDAGRLRIDFGWTAPDTSSIYWISCSIGHGDARYGHPAMRAPDRETDYGILLRGNGETQRFNNGAAATTRSFPPNKKHYVVIELAFDSFADGSKVDATVTINRQQVDHHTFTWNNNSGQLYIELGTLQNEMLIDNLRIIAAGEPEVSTPQPE